MKKRRRYLLCATWDTDSEGDPIVLRKQKPKYKCGYMYYDNTTLEEFNYADFWDNPEKLEDYLFEDYNATKGLKRDIIKKVRELYPKGERPRIFLWGENEVKKLIADNAS